VLASVSLGVFEVAYQQRRMRREQVQTGVEQLVGATGVSERLAPSRRIRVLGELWEARSSSELPPGSRLLAVAVHGLMLDVEPGSYGRSSSVVGCAGSQLRQKRAAEAAE
jgi:membrane protein implicated in regulation of membrane protease activity